MVLADVPVGTTGRVLGVSGADELSIRLMEMGLTPGVTFRIVGTAPLGDPLEIEVRGYRLSVRKCEASRIQIVCTA